MTATTKTCPSCKKILDKTEFNDRRRQCTACKNQKAATRISKSYENYLGNLYSQSRSHNKKGSKARGLEWSITQEDLVDLWVRQGGRCALSGVYLTHHKDGSGPKDHNASIDRIAGDKGYVFHNVQLVCYRINIMKHTLSEDMFYWWVKTINDFSCD